MPALDLINLHTMFSSEVLVHAQKIRFTQLNEDEECCNLGDLLLLLLNLKQPNYLVLVKKENHILEEHTFM